MKLVKRISKVCPRCDVKFKVGGRSGKISKVFCSKKCVLIGKPGRSFGWQKPSLNAIKRPSKFDIAWATGIYEGEGWCSNTANTKGYKTQSVNVGQKDDWLLKKLVELFGGSITSRKLKGYEDQKIWHIHGSRARDFLNKIYIHLSPRRQIQINKIL